MRTGCLLCAGLFCCANMSISVSLCVHAFFAFSSLSTQGHGVRLQSGLHVYLFGLTHLLHAGDIYRLRDGEFLNDSVVAFYLSYMYKEVRPGVAWLFLSSSLLLSLSDLIVYQWRCHILLLCHVCILVLIETE